MSAGPTTDDKENSILNRQAQDTSLKKGLGASNSDNHLSNPGGLHSSVASLFQSPGCVGGVRVINLYLRKLQGRETVFMRCVTFMFMAAESTFWGKVMPKQLLCFFFAPAISFSSSSFRFFPTTLFCTDFATADYYPSDVGVSLKATLKAGLEFSFWSCIDT